MSTDDDHADDIWLRRTERVLSLVVSLVFLLIVCACCVVPQLDVDSSRYAACAEACGPGRLARADYTSCVCTESP